MSDPPTTELPPLTRDFIDAGVSERAARIMAAALDLFAEKGYAATTVREIVNEADVTNPMLYYYFDSKKGLFVALIDILFGSLATQVRQIIDDSDALRPRLRRIARAHFDACHDAPEALRFIYSVTFGPTKSRPEFELPDSEQAVPRMLEQSFCDAIECGELTPAANFDALFLTEHFMGLISNHLMGFLALHDQPDSTLPHRNSIDDYLSDHALDEMLDFFFSGAGRTDSEATS